LGAFIGFFVDNYDIFLPVIALAPAIAYFISGTLSPTTGNTSEQASCARWRYPQRHGPIR
jgi:hypothetical protein